MSFLVLARGAQYGILIAGMAGAILAFFVLIVGGPALQVVAYLAVGWAPAYALSAVWRQTRSLNLTLQVSVVLAIAIRLLAQVVITDQAALWQQVINQIEELWRQLGLDEQVEVLRSNPEILPNFVTTMFVLSGWLLAVLQLVLGGLLLRQQLDSGADIGRFRDVDFGRVLAIVMLVALTASIAVDSILLQNVGLILLAAFLVQGFAAVHWLHRRAVLPTIAVVAMYVLVLVVPELTLMAIAVFGYLDALFRIRRRLVRKQGLR